MYDAGNRQPVPCNHLESGGMGREGGFKRERTYVYLMPIHVDTW